VAQMSTLTKTTGRVWVPGVLLIYGALVLAPVRAAAADNTFDRTLSVSGPVRLELSNASGNVEIRGSGDKKVHIFGKVSAGWTMFGSSEKSIQEVVANPPIEQNDGVIRIGKNSSWIKNVSIEYKIEVPHDTEIDAGVASGGITVDNVLGPVKASSASGYLHAYQVERDTQLSAASGSIEASGIGGILKVSSASGDVLLTDVKGDLKVTAASGSIRVSQPGDRVDATAASGSIEVTGARNDVKVRAMSGSITVAGDPSSNRLWEIKSVSGSVDIRVPPTASFLLTAEASSGSIRTSIPVILEEQGKHSLRAHLGSSSGRIEVRTISGGIDVRGS
jgi:Putative adhesin